VLVPAPEEKCQNDVVAVEKSHLKSVDMRSVRRTQVRHIDQREVDRTPGHVDLLSFETRLVLRGAVMCHSQVGRVQMVDAGHEPDSIHREIFHDGGTVSGLIIGGAHASGVGPAAGPFERPFPVPRESLNPCESGSGRASLSFREAGSAQKE